MLTISIFKWVWHQDTYLYNFHGRNYVSWNSLSSILGKSNNGCVIYYTIFRCRIGITVKWKINNNCNYRSILISSVHQCNFYVHWGSLKLLCTVIFCSDFVFHFSKAFFFLERFISDISLCVFNFVQFCFMFHVQWNFISCSPKYNLFLNSVIYHKNR